MRNKAIGLLAMLVLGLALVGCSDPTEYEYLDVKPFEDVTLSELIAAEEGAFFQNQTRSLRFFADGGLQVFSMGLTMDIVPALGAKYKLVGNDTIEVYRATDADGTPFYKLTYTLSGNVLTLTGKTNGAGNAPSETELATRPTETNPNANKYSKGKLPVFRP